MFMLEILSMFAVMQNYILFLFIEEGDFCDRYHQFITG